MRVTIDEAECIGVGLCMVAAPDVFGQREKDGVVVLLDEDPPERLHSATRKAVLLCPTSAIRVATD